MAHNREIDTDKFIKWVASKIRETHESEYEAKESGEYIKASFAKHEREIYEYIQSQMFVDCTKGYNAFMEEKDKYRWHDIKKNPDDLPNEGDNTILASLMFRGTEVWMICKYEYGMFHDGVNPPRRFNKDINAWRYIEPFEEVKE